MLYFTMYTIAHANTTFTTHYQQLCGCEMFMNEVDYLLMLWRKENVGGLSLLCPIKVLIKEKDRKQNHELSASLFLS